MAIVKWDPFAELNTLHEQVNSLFNDTFGNLGNNNHMLPATDIYHDEKGLTIETNLANFREEEITINQHEDALEIRAEHQERQEDGGKGKNYLMRQSVNQYFRRFALPKNADVDAIDAKLENGILKVHVPYKELPQPKHIAIKRSTNAVEAGPTDKKSAKK
ncbi:Hsp20/alpha crystallin family protein [Candidatus Saccharibacteria bacterium]|nr:Hsp20/alpha crystallin family protein [Candidatus Saccharibacteria bacterium]